MDTVTIMHEYIAARLENSKRAEADFGIYGKAFEIAIRSYIMGRRVKTVKKQGCTDIRFTFDEKRHTCEIKTACGSNIEQAESNQYVIYCATVDPDFPAELQGYVFTREQWIEFINGYPGRGQFIRYNKARNEYQIQSFYVSETIRPKASKPIAAYIESVLFDMPTVEEFFNK